MFRFRNMLALSVLALVIPAASSAVAGPDCTCRYQGRDVAQGQIACLATPKGMVLARCEMVLNNTSWKFLNEPCPYSFIGNQKDRQFTKAGPDVRAILASL